jgi:site-specific DNA-methyltransferase (adenine-specific)
MEGKGNDGKGDIPERDLWETKQELFDILDSQYGFNFDCCASQENKKCPNFTDDFLSREQNYLEDDICWMNPPFSKSQIMFEHFFKVVKRGVAIFRCDNMETKVWQDTILKYADWIFIPKGRVSYTPFEVGNMRNGNGTRFPSALIGIGLDMPKNIQGKTLFVKQIMEVKSGCDANDDGIPSKTKVLGILPNEL